MFVVCGCGAAGEGSELRRGRSYFFLRESSFNCECRRLNIVAGSGFSKN